jgi:hypothetical protein
MEMPCGCVVGDQYLPLQGGERAINCQHAEYIVAGKRVTGMKFTIVSMKEKEEEDEGVTE